MWACPRPPPAAWGPRVSGAQRGAAARRGRKAERSDAPERSAGVAAAGPERTGCGGGVSAAHGDARISPSLSLRALLGFELGRRAAWTGPEHPRAGAAARRATEPGPDLMRRSTANDAGFIAAETLHAARTACRCRASLLPMVDPRAALRAQLRWPWVGLRRKGPDARGAKVRARSEPSPSGRRKHCPLTHSRSRRSITAASRCRASRSL